MITLPQIRAARSLLDWKQSDLAEASGLSLKALSNIEQGLAVPRVSTLQIIEQTLRDVGVDFLPNNGVCLLGEVLEIRKFEGPEYIRLLADDGLDVLRGPEDELVGCIADENVFETPGTDQNERYYLEKKRRGFKQRLLVSKRYKKFLGDPKEYRWLPDKLLGKVGFMVYGDRYCLTLWRARQCIVIRSKSLADTYRAQFDFMWDMAEVPKK
jgi:transcriptional regulator with XRE-family HTH domain